MNTPTTATLTIVQIMLHLGTTMSAVIDAIKALGLRGRKTPVQGRVWSRKEVEEIRVYLSR